MKLNRINLLVAAAISLTLTAPLAFAATFTFSGTAAGSYDWAAGTDWDATPASNLDTILSYTSALADSIAIISNNDVASPPFQLNRLSFTNVGPATGTAPTLALQGGQLELISDTLAATPVLSFNTTGTVLPIISIANNLLLTNDLGVAVADLTNASLSGAISGAGALNKTGLGALTLSGPNNYNGLTTLTAGTLTLDNASALGGGANVTFAGGSLGYTANSTGIDLSTRIKNSASLMTLRLNGQSVNYAGSIDNSNTAGFQVASDGIGVGGMLTVSAANNYLGDTFIGNVNPPGTQDAASITVSGAGTLGSGTIFIGRNGNSNGSLLALTSGASLSNAITLNGRGGTNINIQNLAGTNTLSGAVSLASGGGFYAIQSDAGLLQLTNPATLAIASGVTSARTVTLQGAGNGLITGAITNGSQTLSIAKAGAGTWTLSALSATAASNYTGATSINNGTLAITTTSPTLTGGLTFGAATTTTPGILDLTSANATFGGSMVVNSNSATASEIKIGATRTLTTGSVQIGATTPAVTGTFTKLNMTGGGTFNVTGATFAVGGSSSSTLNQDTTLDLTALSATTINLTGNFRVNPNTTTNIGGQAKLMLPTPVVADTAPTTTITTAGANGITVGGGGSYFNSALMNTITLGTGKTTLNANTINVASGGRDVGQIIYDPLQTKGDLRIRAADGINRATAINVGALGGNTAAFSASPILMDLSGHDADILVTSLNVGNQGRTGNQAFQFNFGAGDQVSLASKLDAINVNIGFRPSVASNTTTLTSRVNLSGGTVTFGDAGGAGNGVDIGKSSYVNIGVNSTIGELNISNGSVTIHNSISMGAAVRLGTNSDVVDAAGTVTASLNLTGGTTTLGGDIVRGLVSPRTTSTVKISGGTLNMQGNDIGTATELITLTAESGTLQNVATINGTGGLTKTTAGALTVSGAFTYTGDTTVSEGILTISSAAAPANANPNNDASTVTIAATGATLDLTYSGTDKVNKLFIGGVQQAAGIYGPSGTFNIPQITNSSGNGTLTVATGPAGYSAWALLNGATADRSADHDFDGVSNGVEFFIGGPTGNTTGFTPLPGVVDTAGVLSVTWTKAAGYLGTYGTDFLVETSATLTGVWAMEPSPGTVAISATTVKYTFPAGTKNFARLKVTGP